MTRKMDHGSEIKNRKPMNASDHWNKKYSRGEHTKDAPLPLVLQFAQVLPPGQALDVACGAGRHALWLAERGWDVTAVDFSEAAIRILLDRAAEKGLFIHCHIADLERYEFPIEPGSFDLIVVSNYLQRDLFPAIRAGTRPGGMVLAAIAMVDSDPDIKPMNPSYLLHPGELRTFFNGWEFLHYSEGKPPGEHRRSTAEIAVRHPY
jgi:tellurite methyltransferase